MTEARSTETAQDVVAELPLIIGCGNLHRGDDAAGMLVAHRLQELGVPARECQGEAMRLMEAWRGCSAVVIIDAVVTGAEAGHIMTWDAHQAPLASGPFRCSSHGFGIAEAIELARTLGRLPPRLTIYGIEGTSFERGAPPSPAVKRAVEAVSQRILHDYRVTLHPRSA